MVDLAKVLDVKVTPVSQDPTGQISGGILRLSGRPKAIIRDQSKILQSLPSSATTIYFDTRDGLHHPSKTFWLPLSACLSTEQTSSFGGSSRVANNVFGLILISHKSSTNVFERIGLFKIRLGFAGEVEKGEDWYEHNWELIGGDEIARSQTFEIV